MADIKIDNLQTTEFEFSELSDLELESIIGGKNWIGSIGDAIRRLVVR